MKNLKIALILLAAVAMFCSCSKDEDAVQDATTVKMTSDVTRLDLRTMEEVVSPLIDLEVTTANEEKITKVTGTVSFYNAEGSADAVSTISFDDFKKDVTYKTQLTFDIAKELMTANGYTKVVVEVIAKAKVEGKGQCTIEFYTSEPEPETTALPTEWSDVIYLARPSMTGYAVVNGVRVDQSENTTIGVAITNTNTGSETKIETTANCEGFVVVANDEFDSVEALAAAYTAGSVETSLMLPFNYHGKAYAEKNFISKIGDDYVLVKYTSGDVYPDGDTQNNGNVYGFKYKKAETTPAAK